MIPVQSITSWKLSMPQKRDWYFTLAVMLMKAKIHDKTQSGDPGANGVQSRYWYSGALRPPSPPPTCPLCSREPIPQHTVNLEASRTQVLEASTEASTRSPRSAEPRACPLFHEPGGCHNDRVRDATSKAVMATAGVRKGWV